jgi:peptide/bleomycin uptake transporter
MIKEFYWSKRWIIWAWGGALILFISLYAQVYMSVLLNEWYGEFYNYFQPSLGGTIEGFWGAFDWFFKLVAVYIVLALWTGWFTRVYAFRWRKAMTFSYIPKWKNVKNEVEGASQRIQLDTERYARIVESLGLQVVRAIMTLIAFTPILWKLSEGVLIKIKDWEIPFLYNTDGNLVWTAISATAIGMVVSWFVGWYLPGLEYKNQVVEAAYRKTLVHGEDDKSMAMPKSLARLFFGLEKNYHRLFLHYGYFDLWYNTYDQLMSILPYIVVGPSVVLAVVPLGVLIQVSNAFGKVHGSMSLFISNWTTITELRSIWRRLHQFEKNLDSQNRDVDTEYLRRKEAELYQFEFGHGITYEMLLNILRPYNLVMTRVVNWCKVRERFILESLVVAPLVALMYIFLYVVYIALQNTFGLFGG